MDKVISIFIQSIMTNVNSTCNHFQFILIVQKLYKNASFVYYEKSRIYWGI